MRNVNQMKKDHALRMNVTVQDELFYKEASPSEQASNLEKVRFAKNEVDRMGEEREAKERRWMDKNYEGHELKDFYNH